VGCDGCSHTASVQVQNPKRAENEGNSEQCHSRQTECEAHAVDSSGTPTIMASCRMFLTFASVTIPLTGGSLIPWQYASKCLCYHQPGGKVGYVCLCRRKLLELVQIKDCFVHHLARDSERRRYSAQTHRLGESTCSISQISDNSRCDVIFCRRCEPRRKMPSTGR